MHALASRTWIRIIAPCYGSALMASSAYDHRRPDAATFGDTPESLKRQSVPPKPCCGPQTYLNPDGPQLSPVTGLTTLSLSRKQASLSSIPQS
ncbi:hypothetical protein Tco_0299865 [Tanacetum coccineum]